MAKSTAGVSAGDTEIGQRVRIVRRRRALRNRFGVA
ncbi:MAG: hypothetical protein QOF99_2954 [Pseudonocardiales bacterium]|jgi:hypothetical protein|nr:hypothetical protein [Pseudonocardiales bacterium]